MKITLSTFLGILFTVSLVSIAQATNGIDRGTTPQPGDTTQSYCLTENQSICSYLLFQTEANTKTPAKFIVKVIGSELRAGDVAVDLWMRMGNGHEHGSAPVKMTLLSGDSLLIEDAYFVMGGEWLVRVKLTIEGRLEIIEIPVRVSR